MAERTYTRTDSKGREEVWSWDETPEVVAALKELHETVRRNNEALNS
jgi:ligand-binding SRPBCC domain-containing protein